MAPFVRGSGLDVSDTVDFHRRGAVSIATAAANRNRYSGAIADSQRTGNAEATIAATACEALGENAVGMIALGRDVAVIGNRDRFGLSAAAGATADGYRVVAAFTGTG